MGANWEANVLSQNKCLNKLRCLSQNDSFKRALISFKFTTNNPLLREDV